MVLAIEGCFIGTDPAGDVSNAILNLLDDLRVEELIAGDLVLYLAGQLGLGLHLSHAIASSVQTMGFEHAALNRLLKAFGPMIGLIVVLGNVTIILAVFLGIVR